MVDSISSQNANSLYEDGLYKDAFVEYEKLALNGDVDSQVFLGWMYEQGVGVDKNIESAKKWYGEAVAKGSPAAEFNMAKALAVDNLYCESFAMYFSAAKKKYAPAIYNVGRSYEKGLGVEKNIELAIKYYKEASDIGHIFALRNLSRLMLKGHLGLGGRFVGIYVFVKAVCAALREAIYADMDSDNIRE